METILIMLEEAITNYLSKEKKIVSLIVIGILVFSQIHSIVILTYIIDTTSYLINDIGSFMYLPFL